MQVKKGLTEHCDKNWIVLVLNWFSIPNASKKMLRFKLVNYTIYDFIYWLIILLLHGFLSENLIYQSVLLLNYYPCVCYTKTFRRGIKCINFFSITGNHFNLIRQLNPWNFTERVWMHASIKRGRVRGNNILVIVNKVFLYNLVGLTHVLVNLKPRRRQKDEYVPHLYLLALTAGWQLAVMYYILAWLYLRKVIVGPPKRNEPHLSELTNHTSCTAVSSQDLKILILPHLCWIHIHYVTKAKRHSDVPRKWLLTVQICAKWNLEAPARNGQL